MNKIEYGTEFLDQLKDSVHDLYEDNKELKKEIERLNNDIKELLKENENKEKVIKAQNNIINEYETRFKIIKEIVEDNILEELNSLEYSMMMSTISSVCDGKPGFLKLGVDKK